jgi:ribokinase
VQAAFPVTPVDTTGAGDTFCGALVAALGRGDGLAGAMRQASAAGALACTRAGAQSSIPTRDEVMALLHTSQENTPAQQAAVRRFCGLP